MNEGRLGERELSRLLDVGRGLVSELDIESVLRQVLEVARELTEARYAALGILDSQKRELERFIFTGIDEETRREIGLLPRGGGILGELIRDPRPLRLADVSEHPHSFGFPGGHPPMTSFLGVPILIRGEAFGNLYLTETAHGEFNATDERSVIVLAEWASIAIDNARLYEGVESRRAELERVVRGLEATTAIARAVGAETDLKRVVELIAKRARALVNARSVAILLPEPDGLRVAATAGEIEMPAASLRMASEGTVLGEVLASGEAESLADLSTRMRLDLEEVRGTASAALLVPLLFRGRSRGVLLAFDSTDGEPAFPAEAKDLLTSFAAAAANALVTALSVGADRLRDSIEASEQERKRWSRELHDEPLQELAALRVVLTSALRGDDPERLGSVVEQALERIDMTIAGLQSMITDLRPAALDELGIAPALEALAERVRAGSGIVVDLKVDLGSTRLDPTVESTLYRLVQEGLNNAVKHARPKRAEVGLTEEKDEVKVTIRDDGVGFRSGDSSSGFGLIGMRERVELVGGTVAIESTPGAGTTVHATVPARRGAEPDAGAEAS